MWFIVQSISRIAANEALLCSSINYWSWHVCMCLSTCRKESLHHSLVHLTSVCAPTFQQTNIPHYSVTWCTVVSDVKSWNGSGVALRTNIYWLSDSDLISGLIRDVNWSLLLPRWDKKQSEYRGELSFFRWMNEHFPLFTSHTLMMQLFSLYNEMKLNPSLTPLCIDIR